jgi:hypothetical protein
MAFELVPFNDIKTLLDISGTSYIDQPELKIIQDRLQFVFEEYLGREFEYLERTETLYIGDTARTIIQLKGIPIDNIDKVQIESYNSGLIELNTGSWAITEYGIKLYDAICNAKIVITYTGGLGSVTNQLKAAALYQLGYEFQAKDNIGAESVSNEGGSVYKPALNLLPETKRMLRSSFHPLKY